MGRVVMGMRNCLLLIVVLMSVALSAQSYDAALGMRIGTEWGATAQIRLPHIHKNFVLESIVLSSIGKDEGTLTLLGKQHQPLISRRLNLFYGAGLHAGWNNEINKETGEAFNGPKGFTGVVGLEATVGKINLGYDFKPAINIVGGESILYTQTALSIRYVIAKRNSIWSKDIEKNKKKRRRTRRREERQEARAKADKRWFQVWKKAG